MYPYTTHWNGVELICYFFVRIFDIFWIQQDNLSSNRVIAATFWAVKIIPAYLIKNYFFTGMVCTCQPLFHKKDLTGLVIIMRYISVYNTDTDVIIFQSIPHHTFPASSSDSIKLLMFTLESFFWASFTCFKNRRYVFSLTVMVLYSFLGKLYRYII